MKSAHLTLICHARTDAQRLGRFHLDEDAVSLPLENRSGFEGCLNNLVAPELRARQTAEALGLAGQREPGLRDCDLGRWKGMSLKRLEQEDPIGLQHWLSDPQASPHGGESLARLCQRVAHWLDERPAQGQWQAVTHPMVIRAALLHVLGCPLQAFHQIDVLPLSVLRVSRHGRWRLRIE